MEKCKDAFCNVCCSKNTAKPCFSQYVSPNIVIVPSMSFDNSPQPKRPKLESEAHIKPYNKNTSEVCAVQVTQTNDRLHTGSNNPSTSVGHVNKNINSGWASKVPRIHNTKYTIPRVKDVKLINEDINLIKKIAKMPLTTDMPGTSNDISENKPEIELNLIESKKKNIDEKIVASNKTTKKSKELIEKKEDIVVKANTVCKKKHEHPKYGLEKKNCDRKTPVEVGTSSLETVILSDVKLKDFNRETHLKRQLKNKNISQTYKSEKSKFNYNNFVKLTKRGSKVKTHSKTLNGVKRKLGCDGLKENCKIDSLKNYKDGISCKSPKSIKRVGQIKSKSKNEDNDLRCRLNKKKEKIEKIRGNVIVTVPNSDNAVKEVDTQTITITNEPEQEVKTIKLVINVICKKTDQKTMEIKKEDKKTEKQIAGNADLGFLDDFNVDDIVECLNYSDGKLKAANNSGLIIQNVEEQKFSEPNTNCDSYNSLATTKSKIEDRTPFNVNGLYEKSLQMNIENNKQTFNKSLQKSNINTCQFCGNRQPLLQTCFERRNKVTIKQEIIEIEDDDEVILPDCEDINTINKDEHLRVGAPDTDSIGNEKRVINSNIVSLIQSKQYKESNNEILAPNTEKSVDEDSIICKKDKMERLSKANDEIMSAKRDIAPYMDDCLLGNPSALEKTEVTLKTNTESSIKAIHKLKINNQATKISLLNDIDEVKIPKPNLNQVDAGTKITESDNQISSAPNNNKSVTKYKKDTEIVIPETNNHTFVTEPMPKSSNCIIKNSLILNQNNILNTTLENITNTIAANSPMLECIKDTEAKKKLTPETNNDSATKKLILESNNNDNPTTESITNKTFKSTSFIASCIQITEAKMSSNNVSTKNYETKKIPESNNSTSNSHITAEDKEEVRPDSIKDKTLLSETVGVTETASDIIKCINTEGKINISTSCLSKYTSETKTVLLSSNEAKKCMPPCTDTGDDRNSKKPETNTDTRSKLKVMSTLNISNLFEKIQNRLLAYFGTKYTVMSLLYSGRYSKILKCKGPNGTDYVLKVTNATSLGYQKENMLKQLQQDIPKENCNCIRIIDGFNLNGRCCFLMDYYPKNLKEALMETKTSFHIDRVQHLSRQLVSAVMVLRYNNIVHTNIKPHHILLNSTSDKLKLCGFDEARYSNCVVLLPNIGTSAYRPPEVLLGYSCDFSADVWTTALVMYEMATSHKLFHGLFNNDILYQQLCTFGNIPPDMIYNSMYKDKHYLENCFMRRYGHRGQQFQLISQFRKTSRLPSEVFAAHHKGWASTRTKKQNVADIGKIKMLLTLLEKMLLMHPRYRLPIEFVYAHPFLYEVRN